MATVTDHASGAPCWFELGTTDQAAAKTFYCGLFGWSVNDVPVGPNAVYTMFQLGGRDAAAAYTMDPSAATRGVTPHWNVYFATPDADASAARAKDLGGTVLQGPLDVMDVGRMAICTDPGGARFLLWQKKRHMGAGVEGENNSVCWAELATWNSAQAAEFYRGLFGWKMVESANSKEYTEFCVDGRARGGLLAMDDKWQGMPSQWGIYFLVADCDVATNRAKELGGTVRFGPFDAPGVGRFVILTDPQGAAFSMITLGQHTPTAF